MTDAGLSVCLPASGEACYSPGVVVPHLAGRGSHLCGRGGGVGGWGGGVIGNGDGGWSLRGEGVGGWAL